MFDKMNPPSLITGSAACMSCTALNLPLRESEIKDEFHYLNIELGPVLISVFKTSILRMIAIYVTKEQQNLRIFRL